jgi:hypothetical protein
MVHITVKTQTNCTLSLDAEREDTVAALKTVILDMVPNLNCTASDMRLIYMGRSLDALRTLGSLNLEDDDNVTYTMHALRPAPSAMSVNSSSSVGEAAPRVASAASAAAASMQSIDSLGSSFAGTGPPPAALQAVHTSAAAPSGGGGGGGGGHGGAAGGMAYGPGNSALHAHHTHHAFPLTPSTPALTASALYGAGMPAGGGGAAFETGGAAADNVAARNLRVQLSICMAERDAARDQVATLRERLAAAEERIATIASHFQVLSNIANAAHSAALSGDAASLANIRQAALAPGLEYTQQNRS